MPPILGRKAIEIDDVVLTYPGGTEPALAGASLRIEPGELVALVGANAFDVGPTELVGTAYLYQRLVGGWSLTMQLFSNQGAYGDRVGETLALDGDEVFVGVLSDEPPAPGPDGANNGSVLIFSIMPTCAYEWSVRSAPAGQRPGRRCHSGDRT
jgi:hypothetical protein